MSLISSDRFEFSFSSWYNEQRAVKEMRKSKESYKWCTDTGIVDDMTESFPLTSSGKPVCVFSLQIPIANFLISKWYVCMMYVCFRESVEWIYGPSDGWRFYWQITQRRNRW